MKTIKKLKSLITLSTLAALLVFSLTGCAGKEAKADNTANTTNNGTAAESGKELRTIRVAFMTGQPDHYAAVIGQEEGIYEKHGIRIEATEYPYGINTIDAIANGTADVGQCADFAGVNRIGNTLQYNQLVFYAELSTSNATTGGVYVAPEYADDLSKLENSAGWITSIGTRSEFSNWYAQTALGLDPDKRLANDSKATYLILSLMEEGKPVLNAFHVEGEQGDRTVRKEELVIMD